MPASDAGTSWHDEFGLPITANAGAGWAVALELLANGAGASVALDADVYEVRTVAVDSVSPTQGQTRACAELVAHLPKPAFAHLAHHERPARDVAALVVVFADQSAVAVTRAGNVYGIEANATSDNAEDIALCTEMAAHLLGAERPSSAMTVPDWLGRVALARSAEAVTTLMERVAAEPWIVANAVELSADDARGRRHTPSSYLVTLVLHHVAAQIAQVAAPLAAATLSDEDRTALLAVADLACADTPDLQVLARAGEIASACTFEQAWVADRDLDLWPAFVREDRHVWNVDLAARCVSVHVPTQEQSLATIARAAGAMAARVSVALLRTAGWGTSADDEQETR